MIYKIWSLPSQPIDLITLYKPIYVSIATLRRKDSSALSQWQGVGVGDTQMAAVSHKSPHVGDGLTSHGSHKF